MVAGEECEHKGQEMTFSGEVGGGYPVAIAKAGPDHMGSLVLIEEKPVSVVFDAGSCGGLTG